MGRHSSQTLAQPLGFGIRIGLPVTVWNGGSLCDGAEQHYTKTFHVALACIAHKSVVIVLVLVLAIAFSGWTGKRD